MAVDAPVANVLACSDLKPRCFFLFINPQKTNPQVAGAAVAAALQSRSHIGAQAPSRVYSKRASVRAHKPACWQIHIQTKVTLHTTTPAAASDKETKNNRHLLLRPQRLQ